MHRLPATTLVVAAALAAFTHPARAQAPVAEFYRGKQIAIVIGYSPGGGYDTYGRLVARYIGKYIPGNPLVVPQNMPGAGSLRAAQHIYHNTAVQDGTAIGVVARGIPLAPLLEMPGADFDAKRFNWIGSTNEEASVCAFWHTAGVKSWPVLREKVVAVGGTGPASDSEQYPKIINDVLATRIKVVSGYPGGNDVVLAMERGEVDGRCSWSWSSVKSQYAHWLAERKIDVVLQLSLAKHPELPNVPLVTELAQSGEDRAILEAVFARQTMAWPFLAAPGVPRERVVALQEAFMAAVKDPGLLADIERANLELNPVSGPDIEALIRRVYALPKSAVTRLQAILK